jgi:glycosyltransferase involved in cell wall biosynthesis
VPSFRAATLLRDAGVAASDVSVTRPGFAVPPNGPPREPANAIVVRRGDCPSAHVAPVLAALGDLPVEQLIAERADNDAVARVAAAPLVVFADGGDDWGLLGTAALAGGALVVAHHGSAFLEIMPPETGVIVDDVAGMADAVRTILTNPGALLERGPRAARDIARRSPDLHAGRRLRELGRAQVHGVVDPSSLAMTLAIAATMHSPAVVHG